MVMKNTFVIILDKSYTNYEVALVNLNKERLNNRRFNLSHQVCPEM